MEPLGPKIRRQRRRLGFTLDELAARASISKPYLSLIETGRVPNPPSDEKLRRLEQTLGFGTGELVTQAHLHRTPHDVRIVLQKLLASADARRGGKPAGPDETATPADLDAAYLTGFLRERAGTPGDPLQQTATNVVPVINRVAAGYPRDFTDLSYPPRVADQYVSSPGVDDREAFAARVHGDSMIPKYQEGDIVIFSPALTPRDGDDCFIRFADSRTTFKRVFFEAADGHKPALRLQPRNERYRAETVASEKVSGLYRAVYRYQRVDEGA